MENNDSNKSNSGVRSAILSGLIMVPSLVGLGFGIKNGISALAANKPNFTPMTGGQPNHLEMIGRSVGSANRSGLVATSLAASRSNLSKGLSSLDAGGYKQTLESSGPRRNALIVAYRRMLNSPVLGLNQEGVASEMSDVLSSMESKSGAEFASEMSSRIKKKALEFGSDRGGEFFSELEKEFKKQLKFEENIEKNGGAIDLASLNTEHPIKTHKLNTGEIEQVRNYSGNGDVGKRAKQSLEELETVISEQGLKGHQFSIYRIQDSRHTGASYVARLTSNNASFDVPLALRRTGLAKGAPGGHTFISSARGNDVSYRTGVVVGTQLPSMSATTLPQGESLILQKFKSAISQLNGASSERAREIAKAYTEDAFGSGQMLSTHYSSPQEALSSLHAWAVAAPPKYEPGNISHETQLRANAAVKPFGATTDQMASGMRYATGAPTIETTLEYYNPMSSNIPGNVQLTPDVPLTSRLQAMNRETTIVGSNKPLNRLGWTTGSMIGFKGRTDISRELITAESASKRTALAFYQFEDSGDTYMHRLRTGEGTYLGSPRNYRVTAASKKDIVPMTRAGGLAKEGRATPLMVHLFEQARKVNGGPLNIRLTRKDFARFGTSLGRDSSDNPIDLLLDSHMNAITVNAINSNKSGNLDVSWDFEVIGGGRNKINSGSFKGTMLRPQRKGTMKGEVVRVTKDQALGRRLAPDLTSVIIAGDKQISRTPLELRSSMIYGAQHILSTETNMSPAEILEWGSHSRWSRISADAAAALVAQKLTKAGVSPQAVSLAVAGVYKHTGDRGKRAIERATGNSAAHIAAIKSAKGFFGVSTYSIGKSAELQGAGKPGTFERRTIHGLLQNLRSSGLNDTNATTILTDIMSRMGEGIPYHKLVTARTFGAAALSTFSNRTATSDLANLAKIYGMDFATTDMDVSKVINFNLKGESWYRDNNVVKFKFDSRAADEAARRVFKTNEILIPGMRGMPGFEGVKGKRGANKIKLMEDYERSLTSLLEVTANPNSSVEAIEERMRKYKQELALASVDTNMAMGSGKVQGSTTGQLLFVNKAQSSPAEYARMRQTALNDNLQSVFHSDATWAGYVRSEKSRIKSVLGGDSDAAKEAYEEMNTKTRMFLFNEDMVDGVGIRHPTLGESHARVTGARRYQSAEQNQRLLKSRKVRDFMGRLGVAPTEENLSSFLSGTLKDKKNKTILNSELKDEFVGIYSSAVQRVGGQANTYLFQSNTANIDVSGIGSVSHMYSRATQMYGDADGDHFSWIATTNKSSNKAMRDALHSGASAETFFKSNTEFASIQATIKKHQNSKKETVGIVDEILHQGQKLIQGKKVELYSASLDALRVSTLAKGATKNPELARQSLAALDILEELLLKSRTRKSSLNIADEFAKAVFGSFDKNSPSDPDRAKFEHILKTHAFGDSDVIEASSNLKDFGLSVEDKVVKTKISINEILDFIWDNYSENRKDNGLTARSLKSISNQIDRGNIDSPQVHKMLESMAEGTHGLIQASTASAAGVEEIQANADQVTAALVKNKDAIFDSLKFLKSPKVYLPVAAGLAVSAIAMNMFSDGHSNRTLEGSSVENEEAVSKGSILGGLRNSLAPQNENGYPEVNRNTILDNETSLEIGGQSGRVESTINGIHNFQPIKQVVGAMGFQNNHIYIQDNRRPITKNYTDRLKEN